jgi:hypothetical protein
LHYYDWMTTAKLQTFLANILIQTQIRFCWTNSLIFILYLTNIKHFPCWYTVISTRVELENARRAECFHTISSFPNFHECWYDYLFFIYACPVIFFDFLQSDWLQQRPAFYDILTVVQKSYFFAKNWGVKTIFKLKRLLKKFKNPLYRY